MLAVALAVCPVLAAPTAAGPRAQRVPDVGGTSVLSAYSRARHMGFVVSTAARAFDVGYGTCPPVVARQSPTAGAWTRTGRVKLYVSAPVPCPGQAPVAPDPVPAAIVPDFTGRHLDAVARWAKAHGQLWRALQVLPLVRVRFPSLLAGYRVTGQDVPAGSTITPGVVMQDGTWRPTPITVRTRPR